MNKKPTPILLFSIPFFLIGVFGLMFGARDLIQGSRSKQWPHTEGVIDSAKTVSQSVSTHQGYTVEAKVSYHYTVDGKYFSADKVAFGDYSSSNPSHAQSTVSRFPPGTKAPVFYSPNDPENAVLEPGVHPGVWVAGGAGIVMLFVGALIFAIYRQAAKM